MSDYLIVNTWIFSTPAKQEQREKETALTSYAAISLSLLQGFMVREGYVRWKLPMTCLYCSNMLPMATVSEKVTNITHCYNPFTIVSSLHSSLHSHDI